MGCSSRKNGRSSEQVYDRVRRLWGCDCEYSVAQGDLHLRRTRTVLLEKSHTALVLPLGKLSFVPLVPLKSPTTLSGIKPLATELSHEFLGILFQRKAVNYERLVIVG